MCRDFFSIKMDLRCIIAACVIINKISRFYTRIIVASPRYAEILAPRFPVTPFPGHRVLIVALEVARRRKALHIFVHRAASGGIRSFFFFNVVNLGI